MRVFLDANIFVSALMRSEGPPGRILAEFYRGRFELVTTEAILAEVEEILGLSRVRRYLQKPIPEFVTWVGEIRRLAEVVEPRPGSAPISRDPDDDNHLRAANAGSADVLVTGDDDLLSLREYEGIRIVTPRKFIEELNSNPPR